MIQPAPFQALAVSIQDASRNHEAMDLCMSNVTRLLRTLETAMSQHNARVTALIKQASVRPAPDVIAKMQEAQLSFNLQYLQIQSQAQQESRRYTAVSNVMKTKHDTVKNSIPNTR